MPTALGLLFSAALIVQVTSGCTRALSESAELQPQRASAPQAVPQWSGTDGVDAAEATTVTAMRTREEWTQLWRKLGRAVPRALDESREMGILISIGERPTGGFSPRVVSATVRAEQLLIVYNEGKPSRDAMVIQAFTKPWVVAIVPKTSLPVVIEHER